MKRYFYLLIIALFLVMGNLRGQEQLDEPYPADYAGTRIRFHALFIYDPAAESAHVEFDRQALHFFHKLSYGEGFTSIPALIFLPASTPSVNIMWW